MLEAFSARDVMELIPAIDVLGGKAVRLRQGRYDEVTVYSADPAALAATWRGHVKRIHVVDLEGARAGKTVARALIERIARAFGNGVEVGGGIRSFEAVERAFELGVERVVLGTAAVRDPELVRRAALAYPKRVVVAVDARGGKVATDGWEKTSERTAIELCAELDELPLGAVLYTDIERDGTEVGPNVEETSRLAENTSFPVIASGGVGTLAHISALASAPGGISAAIVGRALHEERFSLAQAIAAAAVGSTLLG